MTTITNYSSAPAFDSFRAVTTQELLDMHADIYDESRDRTATTDWSRAGLETDRVAIDAILKLDPAVYDLFAAEDEDGYYFAFVLSRGQLRCSAGGDWGSCRDARDPDLCANCETEARGKDEHIQNR